MTASYMENATLPVDRPRVVWNNSDTWNIIMKGHKWLPRTWRILCSLMVKENVCNSSFWASLLWLVVGDRCQAKFPFLLSIIFTFYFMWQSRLPLICIHLLCKSNRNRKRSEPLACFISCFPASVNKFDNYR